MYTVFRASLLSRQNLSHGLMCGAGVGIAPWCWTWRLVGGVTIYFVARAKPPSVLYLCRCVCTVRLSPGASFIDHSRLSPA